MGVRFSTCKVQCLNRALGINCCHIFLFDQLSVDYTVCGIIFPLILESNQLMDMSITLIDALVH